MGRSGLCDQGFRPARGANVRYGRLLGPEPLDQASPATVHLKLLELLYALQDLEFDRKSGLHSIQARLGETGALWVSSLFHFGLLVLLVLLPGFYGPGLGWAYRISVAGCATLFGISTLVVRPGDLSRLNAAFLLANGLLATWLFVATAADLLLRG